MIRNLLNVYFCQHLPGFRFIDNARNWSLMPPLYVNSVAALIQGDTNQNLHIQMAIPLKVCMYDAKLVNRAAYVKNLGVFFFNFWGQRCIMYFQSYIQLNQHFRFRSPCKSLQFQWSRHFKREKNHHNFQGMNV